MDRKSLTPSGSAFLDVVRFATAMVVMSSHMGPFSPRFVVMTQYGHLAVCVFFVLSGFVIRMVTRTRETGMGDFLIDRGSRIYSVVLPALVLTLLLDPVSFAGNPARYTELSGVTAIHPGAALLEVFTNLTFTAQTWGYETNPLSNSPFWSLSFECIYYVVFALIVLGRKPWQRLLAVAILMLAGPSVAFLLPVWWLGVWMYDAYGKLAAQRRSLLVATGAVVLMLAALVVFRHGVMDFLQATDEVHRTAWLEGWLPAVWKARFADATGVVPWVSRATPSFYLFGAIVAVLMLWVLLCVDRWWPVLPGRVAHTLRWVANGTFGLYLFHLPVLILIACWAPQCQRYLWPVAVGIPLLAIVASRWLDRFKLVIRHWGRVLVRS